MMLWRHLVSRHQVPLDLDECSIGMSGLAFAAHREDILCLKYGDVFHRQWHDVKLSWALGVNGS